MSMNVMEVRRWLEEQDQLDEVGVDEGGLAIQNTRTGDYLEIGGIPEDCVWRPAKERGRNERFRARHSGRRTKAKAAQA